MKETDRWERLEAAHAIVYGDVEPSAQSVTTLAQFQGLLDAVGDGTGFEENEYASTAYDHLSGWFGAMQSRLALAEKVVEAARDVLSFAAYYTPDESLMVVREANIVALESAVDAFDRSAAQEGEGGDHE